MIDPGSALLARPMALPAGPGRAAGIEAASRRSAIEFEAMFLSAMLAPVFETLSVEAPFGGGEAETAWRGLLVEQYAEAIARSGGIGVANLIQRELLAIQEQARP